MVTAAMKLKDAYLLLGRKVMTNLDSIFKNIEQSYGLCGRGRGWEDLGEWH